MASDTAIPLPIGAAQPVAQQTSFVAYPLRLEGHLDPDLSRWKWLVKWFLAIPHFVVLAFLWVAFVVLTFVAFFAILFTGRYPRSIFEFDVGVLRWSWRVAYYATNVLGTDRYPPFTLNTVEYPASLDVAYSELSERVDRFLGDRHFDVVMHTLQSAPGDRRSATRSAGDHLGDGVARDGVPTTTRSWFVARRRRWLRRGRGRSWQQGAQVRLGIL